MTIEILGPNVETYEATTVASFISPPAELLGALVRGVITEHQEADREVAKTLLHHFVCFDHDSFMREMVAAGAEYKGEPHYQELGNPCSTRVMLYRLSLAVGQD